MDSCLDETKITLRSRVFSVVGERSVRPEDRDREPDEHGDRHVLVIFFGLEPRVDGSPGESHGESDEKSRRQQKRENTVVVARVEIDPLLRSHGLMFVRVSCVAWHPTRLRISRSPSFVGQQRAGTRAFSDSGRVGPARGEVFGPRSDGCDSRMDSPDGSTTTSFRDRYVVHLAETGHRIDFFERRASWTERDRTTGPFLRNRGSWRAS